MTTHAGIGLILEQMLVFEIKATHNGKVRFLEKIRTDSGKSKSEVQRRAVKEPGRRSAEGDTLESIQWSKDRADQAWWQRYNKVLAGLSSGDEVIGKMKQVRMLD